MTHRYQMVTTTPLSLSGRSGARNTLASPKSPILTHPCSDPSPITSRLDGFRSLRV